MRLSIFGATGKTGIEIVKQALEKGHLVTAKSGACRPRIPEHAVH